MDGPAAKQEGVRQQESVSAALVRTLENLLARYPRDPDALESLLHAYLHEESRVLASQALGRAATRVANLKDAKLAESVLRRLRGLAPKTAEIIKAIDRLRSVCEGVGDETPAVEVNPASPVEGDPSVARGMYIAERLASGGLMGEGELDRVRAEMDRASREVGGRALSFWHILENLGCSDLQAKVMFVARDSGVPPVPLVRFDPSPDALERLPRSYPFEYGALPFNVVAGRLLVAVLDPYDTELQSGVREAAGASCEFFLVGASDYDAALGRIADAYPEGA